MLSCRASEDVVKQALMLMMTTKMMMPTTKMIMSRVSSWFVWLAQMLIMMMMMIMSSWLVSACVHQMEALEPCVWASAAARLMSYWSFSSRQS